MPILKPTVFFGSGPVAAESLAKLIIWHPILAIVTKRTPSHHNEEAPVEKLANAYNIPIFYADNKAELDELIKLNKLPKTTYGIVIDYGVIISQFVIDSFEKGIINSHFSLLPEWRGADPITYSLLSGQQTTGVSVMLIDKGLDTGDLLAASHLKIDQSDDNQSLTEKLIYLSDSLLKEIVPKYSINEVLPYKQPNSLATYSQKLSKQSGVLDCQNRTASELERQIRAFKGWPNSRILYKDTWLTIAQVELSENNVSAGTLKIIDGDLYLGCKRGSLRIINLQPAGKKVMSAPAFINGYAQKFKL